MIGRNTYKLDKTIKMNPDDGLLVKVDDIETDTTYSFTEKIDKQLSINAIVTFDTDEEVFGIASGGLGIIFGECCENKI